MSCRAPEPSARPPTDLGPSGEPLPNPCLCDPRHLGGLKSLRVCSALDIQIFLTRYMKEILGTVFFQKKEVIGVL